MVQAMDFCFGFIMNLLCDFDHVSYFLPCIKWNLEKYAVWFLMLHFIYIDSQGPCSALVTVPLLQQCHVDFNNLELS